MSGEKDIGEWLLRELCKAYIDARMHKRSTSDENRFEVNAMENLIRLRDDIMAHRYKPGRGIAFIIHDPVTREIFAAPFRDRIIHHFLYNQVAEWWDRRFIYDSYSCRKDKGTLFGIKRLQHHIRKVTQMGTREAYVIKLDIQGYFMSLPRKGVYERICFGLEKQFSDDRLWLKDLLKYLWGEVIFDDPTKEVKIRGSVLEWAALPPSKSLFHQPPGQGIVIGNLSSQLISNIYLDQLDRFVRFELGYKNYGRYVDDFFVIVTEAEYKKALEDVIKIEDFLCELNLVLHPKKRYIQNVRRGVPFLGAMVYLDSIVPAKRFKNNFYHAAMEYSYGFLDDASIISYLGYLKHMNGKKLAKKIFDTFGFSYHF